MKFFNALERIFTGLRLCAFIALLVMVVISALTMFAQPRRPLPPTTTQSQSDQGDIYSVLNAFSIQSEHRFTHLETTTAEIYKQLNEIRTNSFIALFGILCLGGETGVRLGKRLTSRQQQ